MKLSDAVFRDNHAKAVREQKMMKHGGKGAYDKKRKAKLGAIVAREEEIGRQMKCWESLETRFP